MDIGDIDVFIGIDVGKSEHWATALSRDGQKVLDKALPNDEDRLREVYQRLQAKGQVLVVVDQPATIGTWRWLRTWASPWATCPGCRCDASLT